MRRTILILPLLCIHAFSADVPKDAITYLSNFCVKCHGEKKPKGNIRLDHLTNEAELMRSRDTLENAWKRVLNREMPPDDSRQPSAAEREAIADWFEKTIERIDKATPPQAGRVTMRRLNRREYKNTIRDLFGISFDPLFDPTADFPQDGGGKGFDTVGDALTTSPVLLEAYLSAAEQILKRVVIVDGLDGPHTWRYDKKDIRTARAPAFANIAGQVPTSWTVDVPVRQSGEYRVVLSIRSNEANQKKAQMALSGADKRPHQFTFNRDGKVQQLDRKLRLDSESGQLSVLYQHEQGKPVFEAADAANGEIVIDKIEISGPLEISPHTLPAGHKSIFITRPSSEKTRTVAATEVLSRYLERVFRRPLESAELAPYLKLFEQAPADQSFEAAMLPPLKAALASPHFLFRIEYGAKPDPRGAYSLRQYELASRLSYFLWSSMPDGELLASARDGKLNNPAELEAQTRRMLKDPRSDALAEAFVTQWLQIENLDTLRPDKKFGDFSTGLRKAMQQEPVLLFKEILQNERSLLELLDTDYSYLSEALAKHYGVPPLPRPPEVKQHSENYIQRYTFADKRRGGVMAMGAVLAVTSHPDRTSPVRRGKWVLESILGQTPPPPPPMVESLDKPSAVAQKLSLRQRLELHRQDATCAGCHKRMDPLGFAFENFDAVGRWRDKEGAFLVDASATLPDGRTFKGVSELKSILLSQKDDFTRCIADKLLTYAIGRTTEPYDRKTIHDIAAVVAKDGYRSSTMIIEIVKSFPFCYRSPATVPAAK